MQQQGSLVDWREAQSRNANMANVAAVGGARKDTVASLQATAEAKTLLHSSIELSDILTARLRLS